MHTYCHQFCGKWTCEWDVIVRLFGNYKTTCYSNFSGHLFQFIVISKPCTVKIKKIFLCITNFDCIDYLQITQIFILILDVIESSLSQILTGTVIQSNEKNGRNSIHQFSSLSFILDRYRKKIIFLKFNSRRFFVEKFLEGQ